MNRQLFAPLKRAGEHLLYIKGAKDCATGRQPQRKNQHYLKGYSEQYAAEQAIDNTTFLENFL